MDVRENNRLLALTVLRDFCARRVDAAVAQMSDEFTWTLMTRLQGTTGANVYTRSNISRLAEISKAAMPDGIGMTVTGSTADTDRVAIEAESHGRCEDGRVYSNVYHFLLEIRDGKVAAIREYMDTAYAAEMFRS